MAMQRHSPPDPPACFAARIVKNAPVAGRLPRFVPHSIQTMPRLPPA